MSSTVVSSPYEAALIIPVPEAEFWVADLRLRYDPSAAIGVPAHITINYPFRPHVTEPTEAHLRLARLLGEFCQFDFALGEIATFREAVYLAPEPREPFLALIETVAALFPESPPYEGKYAELVPHLTVAKVDEASLSAVKTEVSERIQAALPLPCRGRELLLIDNAETAWKSCAVFPLRPSCGSQVTPAGM